MPARRKERRCRQLQGERNFKPSGIPTYELEQVQLAIDEFEVLRLCDYEGKSQIEAAEAMEISRGTIQRLLETGRRKIMDVLLHKKELTIPSSSEENPNDLL